MKIFAVLLSLIALRASFFSFGTALALSDGYGVTYAIILERAELKDGYGKTVTTLPATYFVAIIEETPTSYRVSYLDIEGYVDKNAVSPVDYEPVTKYATPVFYADNDTHPVNLRATPTKNGEIIAVIPDKGKGIYYGKVTGEEIIPSLNGWYFVRYGEGYHSRGYVYAPQIYAMPLSDNIIEKVTEDEEKELSVKPDALEGIFIVLLCIPAVVIMFILFGKDGQRKPRHEE